MSYKYIPLNTTAFFYIEDENKVTFSEQVTLIEYDVYSEYSESINSTELNESIKSIESNETVKEKIIRKSEKFKRKSEKFIRFLNLLFKVKNN